jgi:hypothetical protein
VELDISPNVRQKRLADTRVVFFGFAVGGGMPFGRRYDAAVE